MIMFLLGIATLLSVIWAFKGLDASVSLSAALLRAFIAYVLFTLFITNLIAPIF